MVILTKHGLHTFVSLTKQINNVLADLQSRYKMNVFLFFQLLNFDVYLLILKSLVRIKQ